MTDMIPALTIVLETMTLAELRARWLKVFGAEAPNNDRRHLEARLADRIQELARGGLTPDLTEVEAHCAGINPIINRLRGENPIVVTRLIRDLQRAEHTAAAAAGDGDAQAKRQRSWSATARAITGTVTGTVRDGHASLALESQGSS